MRKIRQRNDIDIVVRLKDEQGVELNPTLNSGYNISVHTANKKISITDYQLFADGRIAFRFEAKDQIRVGVYSITITAKTSDGRVFTTDVCNAFALVACSCETEDGSAEVELVAVEVDASFEITAWGGGDTSESDPIFRASPAAKITDEDIEGWKAQGTELGNLAKVVSGKQDVIKDLANIREGASLGKTALQSVPDEYAKTEDVARDYATKREVQGVLGDINTILESIING